MILHNNLSKRLIHFLSRDVDKARQLPLSDYHSLCQTVVCGDILLIEGRSRAARVISYITRSVWTHSVLYVGHLELLDENTQTLLMTFNPQLEAKHIIIESVLGEGVVAKNLNEYNNEHVRICRAKGITKAQQKIILNYACQNLGKPYDHKQIFDLARFLFPWFILPRKWRSSLFQHNAQAHAKMTCSLLLAQAFIEAKFPILPTIEKQASQDYFTAIIRNPRLFVPCDFDYSPFFEIIKYPMVTIEGNSEQIFLWNNELQSNDHEGFSKIT